MSDKPFIDCNSINPVDYYNMNCVQEMYDQLVGLRNVKSTGIDSLTYITNKEDASKRMIIIESSCFVAKMMNGLNMEINRFYTPFMMLQKYIYKDSFILALSHVLYEIMGHESKYLRVGVKFYKIIHKIDRYGINREELKAWDRSTIVDDHGRDYIATIPKFDDFTTEPDNKNFRRIVDNCYNVYSPFSHTPKEYKNDEQIKWTINLLKHLFGSQYKYGLRYLKVLYSHPKQTLPILVLISDERQTGKSTLIDWMSMLFGQNTVIINPENIGSQFNGSYAAKNIIMIEESHFDSRQATEKLKNLSTQKNILVNTKHISEYSVPFYGKIIITSNDEEKFSKVDDPEIRYWVRKVPSLKGKANHKILEDMVKEIPYFLGFLDSLPPVDLLKSRMVFEAIELKTDALQRVKLESRSELHKEIEIRLDDWCLQNLEVETVYFIGLDFKAKFFDKYANISASYIQKVLRAEVKITPNETTTRYRPFQEHNNNGVDVKVGKPFSYKNPYFGKEIGDISLTDDDDNLPF